MTKPPTPEYKAVITFNLPTDPPWRTKPDRKQNTIKTTKPEGIVRGLIIEATKRLSMDKDIGFLVGIMCNIINPFPEETRRAIIGGIVQGLAFTSAVEGDEIVGYINPTYPALESLVQEEPQTIQLPNNQEVVVLPSGLAIPRH